MFQAAVQTAEDLPDFDDVDSLVDMLRRNPDLALRVGVILHKGSYWRLRGIWSRSTGALRWSDWEPLRDRVEAEAVGRILYRGGPIGELLEVRVD